LLKQGVRIFVAGHTGLAGSALVRALRAAGHTDVLTPSRADVDLTEGRAVEAFFQAEKPDVVFLAAAKVGGILANDTYPAEFIQQNIAIQYNVIHQAWRAGVERLLFLSSSCIYPRECPQPIREEYLLTGPLESTNRSFAVAKIAGIEMCWAYNRQYGTRYLCAMSTNLYGDNDTYDLQGGHVLPAMIRRFHEAKLRGDARVTLWGTGTPRREFLSSDDLASACLHLMSLPAAQQSDIFNSRTAPLLNIGCGQDHTIRELAEMVRRIVDADVEIDWDTSKPDGTPRKLMDVSRLSATGWQPRIALEDGLRRAYAEFLAR
jgi:GDP-L-fucose synthase